MAAANDHRHGANLANLEVCHDMSEKAIEDQTTLLDERTLPNKLVRAASLDLPYKRLITPRALDSLID
jgi:hypothetical protein